MKRAVPLRNLPHRVQQGAPVFRRRHQTIGWRDNHSAAICRRWWRPEEGRLLLSERRKGAGFLSCNCLKCLSLTLSRRHAHDSHCVSPRPGTSHDDSVLPLHRVLPSSQSLRCENGRNTLQRQRGGRGVQSSRARLARQLMASVGLLPLSASPARAASHPSFRPSWPARPLPSVGLSPAVRFAARLARFVWLFLLTFDREWQMKATTPGAMTWMRDLRTGLADHAARLGRPLVHDRERQGRRQQQIHIATSSAPPGYSPR